MKKRKYLAINFVLLAILFFSVSFNKEYIRPAYGSTPIIGIMTGSYSNFMAAYIISLFPVAAILSKRMDVNKSRVIFYMIAILVFIILTIEEIKPFVSASKVYDLYDIIASGLGSFFAALTFEIFIKKFLKQKE